MKAFLLLTLLLSNAIALSEQHATGLKKPADAEYGVAFVHFKKDFVDHEELPAEYDLRDYGYVSPIRNQGQCGSCWSFSTIDSYESSILKFGEHDVAMSQQQIVNCQFSGCGGGFFAFDYIQKKGVTKNSSLPYQARNGRCVENFEDKYFLNYWWRLGKSNASASVEDIKAAVYHFGAVSVTVWAGGLRNGGDVTSCGSGGTDHMVTIIGWKIINGKEKWIVKNSWGTSWGEKGFAYVAHRCANLAEDSAVSVFKAVPVSDFVPHVQLKKNFSRSQKELVFTVPEYEDTTYTWYLNGVKALNRKPYIVLNPRLTTEVKVVAENSYAIVESKSKIGD